jgi:hypothetical protein
MQLLANDSSKRVATAVTSSATLPLHSCSLHLLMPLLLLLLQLQMMQPMLTLLPLLLLMLYALQIVLKKQYMNQAPTPPGCTKLSGEDWYTQSAARAVNQVIIKAICIHK